MNFRFHILGVPHTVSSKNYNACAFTQKVVKFGKMMTERGHTIIHYGHEDSDLICSEHVTVLTNNDFEKVYGSTDWKSTFFNYNINDEAYKIFYKNAIFEIGKRKKPNDFLLPFWGAGVRPICDAHNDLIVVEPGIGYAGGHWARWKIWESYAIYHASCGLESVAKCKQDNYSVVIPNYFDPEDFEYCEEKEDYFLYLGRVYNGKGVNIAIDACIRANVKLIIAGQKEIGYEIPKHENIEFIGYADIKKRKELMKKARASFLPSQYLEPFGGVQIENLLSGTPTITSDWGCFAENNIHGFTGYRCRTMGDYIDAIYECKKGSIKSENCRKFGENFLFEKVAPRYEKYFKDVMDVHTGKGWYSKGNGLQSLILDLPFLSEKIDVANNEFNVHKQGCQVPGGPAIKLCEIILYSHSDVEDYWPVTFGTLNKFAKHFKIHFITNKVLSNEFLQKYKIFMGNLHTIIYDETLSYTERIALSFPFIKSNHVLLIHEDMLVIDELQPEKFINLQNFMHRENIDYIMSYDTSYMDSFNSDFSESGKYIETLFNSSPRIDKFPMHKFFKMRLPYLQPAIWNYNAFQSIFKQKIHLSEIESGKVARLWGNKLCLSIQNSETIGQRHTTNSYFFPHYHAGHYGKYTFCKYPKLKMFMEDYGVDTSKRGIDTEWLIKVIEDI